MKADRILLSKLVLSLALLLSTGIPVIFIQRVFLPAQVNLFAGILAALSYMILWQDLIYFKKDWRSWIFALILCLLALLRRNYIPPFQFKMYDIFFIVIALSCIYTPSRIQELLIFSCCVIAPLSLAGIYGFIPSSSMSFLLVSLGILLGILWPKAHSYFDSNFDTKNCSSSYVFLCLLFVILFGMVSILSMIYTKGAPKNKRILFDRGHGTTESPLIDYTKNTTHSASFGHARLVSLLKMYGFYPHFTDEINHTSLSRASILVLIMPSEPYKSHEIKAIKEFVSNGGGLLVIGDHTDISNVLSSLNPVIEHFGIQLRFDTIWIQTNSRSNLCYRLHPALFDCEEVNFSVGASLALKSPARPIIMSHYGTFSDLGDHANDVNGYLGNAQPDPGERTHDLCLIADSRYGKGRVFVLGDSSYFQNTCIYRNWVFAYRLFDWLNHYNDENAGKKAYLIATILVMTVILSILVYSRIWPSLLLPALAMTLILSLWCGGLYNLKRFPKPEKKFETILLDMAHKNEYTHYWMSREKIDTGIDGAISQIIRTGFFPAITSHDPITSDTLREHKAIFIICPNTLFGDHEIEAISSFVEKGGGLLLVEGPRKWATSYALWERFGLYKDRYPLSAHKPIMSPVGLPLRLQYGNFQAQFIHHPVTDGISRINMVNPCRVQGGLPLAFIDSIPVIHFKEYGKGRIVAIGDDRFFANYRTEFNETIIDPDKVRILWNIVGYLTHE
ncbi:MAG: DUF4350 domain-containing protein [bacterium]